MDLECFCITMATVLDLFEILFRDNVLGPETYLPTKGSVAGCWLYCPDLLIYSVIIDREAREIMHLVASVCPSVCPSVRLLSARGSAYLLIHKIEWCYSAINSLKLSNTARVSSRGTFGQDQLRIDKVTNNWSICSR